MRKSLLALVLCVPTVALACKKQDEQPPAQQPMYAPQAPGAQPAPAQPAPAATPAPAAPAATPAPAAPAAAAPAGPLSQPGPLAGPCTSDANCFTHRCNTQVGKCVLPCVTNNDCNAGNNCMAGVCVPALPQQ
jgi:hypothetical protein